MRLSQQTHYKLHEAVETVKYNRSASRVGVVHIGPGGFHRGHQAFYCDKLLELGYIHSAICAVSMNSSQVRDALLPQDYLYTLAVLDKQISYRVIGSIKSVLWARDSRQEVIEKLCDPTVKVVTLTITEKGYYLGADGHLNDSHIDIQHDIDNPDWPVTAPGLILTALRIRRSRGIAPFVPLSCDNLSSNGKCLHQSLIDLSNCRDNELARWVEHNVHCPSTMVDSITPATNAHTRETVSKSIGVVDQWPIQRESFTQWVIEDLPGVELPPWHDVGATLSKNVNAYETAKLRVLNGLHTVIAFVGMQAGYKHVGEVVDDADMHEFLWQVFSQEIKPNLLRVPGLDTTEYMRTIIRRFKNPAIVYTLDQIAWDSSQKIPVRILSSLLDNINSGRKSPALCLAIACWIRFIESRVGSGEKITDPLSSVFSQYILDSNQHCNVEKILSLREIFPETLANNIDFRKSISESYEYLSQLRRLNIKHWLAQSSLPP